MRDLGTRSTSNMELPIFNDNLRSSASWTVALAREQEGWANALASSELRPHVESRVRDQQLTNTLLNADPEIDRQRLLDAMTKVSSWAGEPDAKLNVDRLLELHRLLIGVSAAEDVLRKTEPLPINAMHDPTPAILLPRMLDNAFDWFTTPSFGELRAVEQAAVVYLRLLDLHPFPSQTPTTALLAAGFYTERAGLPPLVIPAGEEMRARHTNVLDAAFRMLTQPLVEFFAELLTRTIRLGLGIEK